MDIKGFVSCIEYSVLSKGLRKRLMLLLCVVTLYSILHTSDCLWASFEQQGISARPLGLGGAFTGLADSVDAVFINPAGLCQTRRPELSGTFSKLYVGLDDNSNLSENTLLYSYPFRGKEESLSFGAAALGVSVFNLPGYYTETSAGIFYSGRISKSILAGAGLKYLTIAYGTDEYTAINPVFAEGTSKSNASVDCGVMYLPSKTVSFGLSLHDLNSPDMGLKYEDKLERTITLGAAYKRPTYNVLTDFSVRQGNTKIVFGGEKWFMSRKYALRAALGLGSGRYSRFNLGGTYDMGNVYIDYAFYYPLSGLSDMYGSHVVSLGYKFGPTVNESKIQAAGLYKAGVELVKSGKYSEALDKMKEAAATEPSVKEYGETSKRLELITEHIKAEQKISKRSNAVRNALAKYAVEGEAKKSVNLMSYALSLNPENKPLEKLMRTLAERNNIVFDDSAKTWNLAEQKVFKALEYFKQKRYDECVKLCEEALEFEPDNVLALKRLGSTFYILKNYERAKENWSKALKIAPNDVDAPQIRDILKKLK